MHSALADSSALAQMAQQAVDHGDPLGIADALDPASSSFDPIFGIVTMQTFAGLNDHDELKRLEEEGVTGGDVLTSLAEAIREAAFNQYD